MLSRETEIIESFALIEMSPLNSPMLSPNLNLDQGYPYCRTKFIRRGLILIVIVRDQLIFQNNIYIIFDIYYISIIDTETCLTVFSGSVQSHFVSYTLDRIFCRFTGRGTASKTRYWAPAKADKIQTIITISSHWAISEEWLTYWVAFGENALDDICRIIQLFNYLSLPNHTNYSFDIIDVMLLILARQQNRGCDYIENAYLASSQ